MKLFQRRITTDLSGQRSISKRASFFLALVLSFVLAVSPGLAFAAASDVGTGNEVAASSVNDGSAPLSSESDVELSTASNEITVFAVNDNTNSTSLSGNKLFATVTYDPYFIQGEPTRFTLNVSGNTYPLLYRMFSLEIKREDNKWYSLVDSSRDNPLSEKNYYETQLPSAGEYQLRFQVHEYEEYIGDDGKKYKKMGDMVRFAVTFTVNESGGFETVNSVVSRVTSQCLAECSAKGDTSDYAKALWLNDWLVDNANYDGSLQYSSPEGVLLRGIGTCESFHQAYVLLLNKLGIETRRVEDRGDLHVWTGVKMDGKWYNVDVTWNDGDPGSSFFPDKKHLYFGVTTEVMKAVHQQWNGTHLISYYPYVTEPFDANSYEDNYFIKSGAISQYTNPYLANSGTYSVKAQLNAGARSFTLPVEKSSWPDSYKTNIYTLVAYSLSQRNWGNNLSVTAEYKDDALHFTAKQVENPLVNPTNPGGNSGTQGSSGTSSTQNPSGNNGSQGTSGNTGTSQGASGNQGNSSSSATTPSGNTGVSGGSSSGNTSAGNSGNTTQIVTNAQKPESAPVVKGTWKKTKGKWWFSYDAATKAAHQNKKWPVNEWVKIGSKIYHFDGSGYMHYGWKKLGGDWYYFGSASDGVMKKNWQKVGGKWYYLDPSSGKMQTRWLTTGGATYYLNPTSGAILTGWQKLSLNGKNNWYYFNSAGKMQKNRWIGNYYVYADGTMATNTWIGKYHVNSSGKWDRTR